MVNRLETFIATARKLPGEVRDQYRALTPQERRGVTTRFVLGVGLLLAGSYAIGDYAAGALSQIGWLGIPQHTTDFFLPSFYENVTAHIPTNDLSSPSFSFGEALAASVCGAGGMSLLQDAFEKVDPRRSHK